LDLREVLSGLKLEKHPDLLVGIETSDDAGVYRLTPEVALIQTLDFFTPIVNDPYDFGRIAATNAFSDVYAMGGKPLTAMNIVCFPIKQLDKDILRAILQGGLDVIHKAGAVMVGGHSVEDNELKYGLSVTGIVHPERILTNAGVKVGDLLVLTKPLGTGILSTALKGGKLNEKQTRELTELMATLNKDAAEVMAEIGVNACTDITGFGLLGHAIEMAKASNICIRIYSDKVPVIPEALEFASIGMIPEGSHLNQKFCSQYLDISPELDPIIGDILADAQTSGGLLISVPEEKSKQLLNGLIERNTPSASVIGEVLSEPKGIIQIR
jgi:selenide,water dikinase